LEGRNGPLEGRSAAVRKRRNLIRNESRSIKRPRPKLKETLKNRGRT